jgi:hypothetical protein
MGRIGCGCGSMVECGLPKPETRVRFPSPAPTSIPDNEINRFKLFVYLLRFQVLKRSAKMFADVRLCLSVFIDVVISRHARHWIALVGDGEEEIVCEQFVTVLVYCIVTESLKGMPNKLLTHFRQNVGKVLSRDELAREVWGLKMDPRSRCIDQTIATIRKALAPSERIETVQGHGYRFESPVTPNHSGSFHTAK